MMARIRKNNQAFGNILCTQISNLYETTNDNAFDINFVRNIFSDNQR